MKKLLISVILVTTLFSCAKENDQVQEVSLAEISLEERNAGWLTLDSITYDPRFQVIYFQDKGKKRQLGIFTTSPFLLYPNQSLLIDRTINVNIKKSADREYLIYKNK